MEQAATGEPADMPRVRERAMRKTAVACGVIGVILLAAAAVLAFWIAPSYIARLPSSSDTVRTYDGKVQTLVDPAALAAGNFAGAIKAGLPLSIRREVKVLQTSGNSALVRDSSDATASGRRIGGYSVQYAVDRTSLAATADHPASWSVIPAQGLVVSWPIPAQKQNYTGWDEYTHTTTQLKYLREEQHAGITTYVYQGTVPMAPIRNTDILASLPKSVPVSVLKTGAKAGLISSSVMTQFARAFPTATRAPLGYTYSGTSTYWVAPATGEVVDVSTTERQMGGLALPGGRIVPVLPVLADTYKGNPSSVSKAVSDANSNAGTISLFSTVLPIIAAIVGAILLILAVILWIRGRPARA